MARHHIPGAAIALLEGGELASVETHGHLGADGEEPVGGNTLFAAASISKHVTTFGLLRLAQEQGLDLHEDVNRCLSSWQLPSSDAGDAPPVTLRHLVANLAGLADPVARAARATGSANRFPPSSTSCTDGRRPNRSRSGGSSLPARCSGSTTPTTAYSSRR
jgi:CubicO group peptidase (beta-lactamase class C family)